MYVYNYDQFIKTGSGQTSGKVQKQKRRVVCRASGAARQRVARGGAEHDCTSGRYRWWLCVGRAVQLIRPDTAGLELRRQAARDQNALRAVCHAQCFRRCHFPDGRRVPQRESEPGKTRKRVVFLRRPIIVQMIILPRQALGTNIGRASTQNTKTETCFLLIEVRLWRYEACEQRLLH